MQKDLDLHNFTSLEGKGRGRGSHKSHCILIYSSKTNVCKERMEIMEED